MTDIRKENCLGAIDFGQRFGPFTLLFVSPSARYGRRNLRAGELKKASILIVEGQAPTDASHQKPGVLLLLNTGFEGNDKRRVWRV
jgi:hypothetical protein